MTFGSEKRCRATGKRTGEQCKNPAVANSDFCFLHNKRPAGKRGAPRDNKNNLRHGASSKILKEYQRRITEGGDLDPGFLAFNILDMEERKEFLVMVDGMCVDFNPTIASDFHEIEHLATCMILLNRATKRGNMKAISALERTVRLCLRDLKSGKKAAQRAADRGKTQRKMPPAEWASALFKRIREEEERERAAGRSIEKMTKAESEDYSE